MSVNYIQGGMTLERFCEWAKEKGISLDRAQELVDAWAKKWPEVPFFQLIREDRALEIFHGTSGRRPPRRTRL